MNLASTLSIYSGGPGSGCNPAVAKPKCGRPEGGGQGTTGTNAKQAAIDHLRYENKYYDSFIGQYGPGDTEQRYIDAKGLDKSIRAAIGDKQFNSIKSIWSTWAHGNVSMPKAQIARLVAANYYGRNPKDEFTGKYKNVMTQKNTQKSAEEVKQGLLDLKDMAKAVVEDRQIKEAYRGVTGKLAEHIIKQLQEQGFADVPVNSLESYSTDHDNAFTFAMDIGARGSSAGGVVYRVPVNLNDVWSVNNSLGSLHRYNTEDEIVLGSKSPTIRITNNDAIITPKWISNRDKREDVKTELEKQAWPKAKNWYNAKFGRQRGGGWGGNYKPFR